MTAPYSMDLRERALARKEAGETNREIAAALRIAPSCVSKWTTRKRETGSVGPAQGGGDKPTNLAARGIKSNPRAVWVFVHAQGLSFKKNPAARRTDAP